MQLGSPRSTGASVSSWVGRCSTPTLRASRRRLTSRSTRPTSKRNNVRSGCAPQHFNALSGLDGGRAAQVAHELVVFRDSVLARGGVQEHLVAFFIVAINIGVLAQRLVAPDALLALRQPQ